MGSAPTTQAVKEFTIDQFLKVQKHEEKKNVVPLQTNKVMLKSKQSSYAIPQLQINIASAYKDLHSKDPIGKKRYFFKVINFIFEWLQTTMKKQGISLFQAENRVSKDLQRACKDYPIGKLQPVQCFIKDIKPQKLPDLAWDLKVRNKQAFTDRIKQLGLRSKQVSYQFNKEMQLILEKQGGYKFKAGYKNTGTKAYMRIMTKILDDVLSEKQGSKQVYTDMNHYYWTPIFNYFNKIIDKNIQNLKINLYDWIRCKVSFKNIKDLQNAYKRLQSKHGKNIFRVKNRINLHTRDILINLKYKTQYTEIQLALSYDSSAYDFNHKLYELTREKLGVAYCCFTFLMNQGGQDQASTQGVMTQSGYIKRTLLRQTVEIGFERLTKLDAQKQYNSIKKLLGEWDVVALKSGVIKGHGYKPSISSQLYGPQTAQMMIIKRRSEDPVKNWLNWMETK